MFTKEYEAVLEDTWKEEFLELAHGVLEKIFTVKGIEITLILNDSNEINAYAAHGETENKYTITITKGIRDSIFWQTVGTTLLDQPIEFMRNRFECREDTDFLKKIICISSWTLLFSMNWATSCRGTVSGYLGSMVF